MKNKKILQMLLLLPAILTIVSCNNQNGKDKKTLVVGTTSKIEKAVRDEYNYDVLASGLSELPLVSKNTDGTFSPLLVNYESVDSKEWKFTLEDEYCWSDGEKVTADDILFSLKYDYDADKPLFTEGDEKGEYASYSIANDKKSITLILEEANVKYLENLTTLRIRPEHIYKDKEQETISDQDCRVVCGPYVLSSFSLDSNSLTFVKNEHYPKSTNFEKVTYRLFSDDEMLYNALNKGDVDYVWNYSMSVPSSYQTLLKDNESIKFTSVAATNCPAVLLFNNANGFGADINIRKAISYALDYGEFQKYFGSEFASTPNKSFAPSSLIGYKETDKLSKDYSIADEYMKAAGYEKLDNYYVKDNKRASFSLTVNSKKETHLSYAEFVKNQLEKFGIEVVLDVVDSTLFNEKTSHKFANEGSNAFGKITMEAAIMGFTSYGMNNFGGMYINGNHAVQGGGEVYDERLDTIMNNLNNSKTLEEYSKNAGDLQDFYAENIPAISLFWDSAIYAYSNKLSNVHVDGTFGLNNIQNFLFMNKE